MTDLRTFVLLAGLTALFLAVGYLLGGEGGMALALIFAITMNFWAYWNSDRMVLRMHNAYEVGPREAPEYYAIVQELARRAQLPMPRVHVIDDPAPNAFATGRNAANAAVAATTGLLRSLNREEIAGVMAHEMAHVENHDILISTITATMAGAITAIANMAQWAAIFGAGRGSGQGRGNGTAGLLMILLAPLAAMLIQLAVSRSREYLADQRGARLCGNPLWLASALDKLEKSNHRTTMWSAAAHPSSAHLFIVNPLSGTSLAAFFSTHPPMEERIHRLHTLARKS